MPAASAAAPGPQVAGGRSPIGRNDLPAGLWWAAVAAASAVPLLLARGSYFFADDYLFLEQARVTPFGWSYLSTDLFGHFSPVTRLLNKVLVHSAPGSWTLAWTLMVGIFVALVVSVQFLARALHGRTVTGLVMAVVMILSLGTVRILQWWTATANLGPGIVGLVLGFAAYVHFRRTGALRWALLCLGAYLLAVFSYELIMILPWYLLLAELLLLPARFADERISRPDFPAGRAWGPVVTGLWVVLALIGGAAALNYRTNYFQPTPRPALGDAVRALGVTVGETLAPAALGLFRPGEASSVFVAVAVLVWSVLMVWTLRSRSAWRGWAFAALGVAPPVSAVIISRVGLYGTGVGRELYYSTIPMLMLVVGATEAVRWRLRGPRNPRVPKRVAGAVAGAVGVAYGLAFVFSGVSIRDVEGYAAASRAYTGRVVEGIDLAAREGPVSVLDTDVPANVVPVPFRPYNRASRVIGLYRPDFRFDGGGGALQVIGPDGSLRPALESVRWEWSPGTDPRPPVVSGGPDGSLRGGRWCISPERDTRLRWELPAAVAGTGLVVAVEGSVSTATSYGWWVDDGTAVEPASFDPHEWPADRPAAYETVRQERVVALELAGLTPGSTTCISRVAVLGVGQG